MVARLPLVLVDGVVSELPAGDTLVSPDNVERQNNSGYAVPAGSAMFCSSGHGVNLADNSVAWKLQVMGLAVASVAVDAQMKLKTDGRVVLTASEWDVVTGQSGGLDANKVYYLGTNGGLTDTPPTSGWQVVVGLAISATELVLRISQPIEITS